MASVIWAGSQAAAAHASCLRTSAVVTAETKLLTAIGLQNAIFVRAAALLSRANPTPAHGFLHGQPASGPSRDPTRTSCNLSRRNKTRQSRLRGTFADAIMSSCTDAATGSDLELEE